MNAIVTFISGVGEGFIEVVFVTYSLIAKAVDFIALQLADCIEDLFPRQP